MIFSNSYKSFFLILTFFLSLSMANYIREKETKPTVFVSKQDSVLNLNYNLLEFTNLGHKRLLSSMMWVSTIIESDLEHYKNKDLNSWLFLRFYTISKLEPKFLTNYTFGGPYLSIVKDDLIGATSLYNKGLEYYPNDYELLKNAAFHFRFEVGDLTKSKFLYSRLYQINQNPLIASTYARLISSDGNLEDAYIIMSAELVNMKGKYPFIENQIRENLYAIRAELDLNCLNKNNKKSICRTVDFNGNLYLIKNGKYEASKNWTKFKNNK